MNNPLTGFKQCNNGHFYDEGLNRCPFCPAGDDNDATGKLPTQINSSGNDKTSTFINDNPKTQTINNVQSNNNQNYNNHNNIEYTGKMNQTIDDFEKTFIPGQNTPNSNQQQNPIAKRKMVGWLVSFTFDDFGVDYRLYEGRNTIGRNTKNNITIVTDKSISDEHAVILFINDMFFISDEMSSVGTYVNNEFLMPKIPRQLKDGDSIRMGTTVFKFKTVF